MKSFLGVMLISFAALVFQPFSLHAQNVSSSKQKSGATPVSLKNGGVYKFTANYVYPTSGRSKYLSPTYDLIFSKDTLNGQLPYFGVANTVDYGSSDVGVNLQTSGFTFDESTGKKGRYVIRYKLQGDKDVINATFTIYKDGTADLLLNFLQRQSISYRGNVTSVNKP